MARGKRLSYEDKIAKLIKQMEEISDKKKLMIATYDEQLKQLQNETKELRAHARADKISELTKFMDENGLTVEQMQEYAKKASSKA